MSKSIQQYREKHPWCEICGRIPIQIHHIKTRGAGGSDEPTNLIGLCIDHHAEVHTIGRHSFFLKYQSEGDEL